MEIKTLYKVSTYYNQIKIVEDYPIRKMLFGYGMCQEQGAINLEDHYSYVYDFNLLFMHSFFFVPRPSNVLVIGLGAAVNPRHIAHYCPDTNIDIIEIDPEVVKIAKEYFFFQESDKVKVYVGDALNVISSMDKKYDMILMDAYNKHYIPSHLMSRQFNSFLFDALEDDGVLAINTCNVHMSFFSHINTVRSVFGDNLFILNGFSNKYSSIVYALKKNIQPQPIEDKVFEFLVNSPLKLELTDNIKNAKIIEP